MCSVPDSPVGWLLPGLPIGGKKTAAPPQMPAMPQAAKEPDMSPLKKRNSNGGLAMPTGSTLLTGPSGIAQSSLLIGQSSLLGGDKPPGG